MAALSAILMDECANLWGAVIRQAARDARQVNLVIPSRRRKKERETPFRIRKNKAISDQNRARHSARWFHTDDFRYVCGLCGADSDHVLDLLRKEGLEV